MPMRRLAIATALVVAFSATSSAFAQPSVVAAGGLGFAAFRLRKNPKERATI